MYCVNPANRYAERVNNAPLSKDFPDLASNASVGLAAKISSMSPGVFHAIRLRD